MYSIVKCLRDKGAPRTTRGIADDEGFEGELRFSSAGTAGTAFLIEPDDEHMRTIIPALEYAQLVTMHVDMMRFRGIERDKAGVGYEQEWSVRFVGYGPPDDGDLLA
jgi:hypothetical protein